MCLATGYVVEIPHSLGTVLFSGDAKNTIMYDWSIYGWTYGLYDVDPHDVDPCLFPRIFAGFLLYFTVHPARLPSFCLPPASLTHSLIHSPTHLLSGHGRFCWCVVVGCGPPSLSPGVSLLPLPSLDLSRALGQSFRVACWDDLPAFACCIRHKIAAVRRVFNSALDTSVMSLRYLWYFKLCIITILLHIFVDHPDPLIRYHSSSAFCSTSLTICTILTLQYCNLSCPSILFQGNNRTSEPRKKNAQLNMQRLWFVHLETQLLIAARIRNNPTGWTVSQMSLQTTRSKCLVFHWCSRHFRYCL